MTLAYQFVAGLKLEIKEKLAGVEGDFDKLLTKARFKEAKIKEWRSEVAKSGRTQRAPTEPVAREGKKPPVFFGARRRENPSIQCHNCGGLGHIARQCTVSRRATTRETQARGGQIKSSHLVNGLDGHQESGCWERSKRAAMEGASAILNTLTTGEPERGLSLGPKLRTGLLVNGMPATALVDTGSPITILSLSYLLQVWWTQRDKTLPRWKWKEEVIGKLADPTITLKAYNGTPLNVLAEVNVILEKGSHRCEATVMVQEDAPQDVLLGTHCLSQLGIQLTGLEEPPHPNTLAETEEPVATVKLLHSTKIPAGFGRPVRATLMEDVEAESKRLWMLEPSDDLGQQGAMMEVALVELDKKQQVTLVVNNCGRNPIHLEAGERLGTLVEVELTPIGEATEEVQSLSVDTLCSNRSESNNSDRDVRLCQALGVDAMRLTLTQKDELVKLLLQYSDVFALEEDELGATSAAQHAIDTGVHPPIHQHPRRVPHALKGKIQELIDDMMRRNVIRPSQSPWASPVVLVTKRDGSTRFCVDYRRLNSLTKLDMFPLPRIDDYLDTLARAKYFSALDLASGYWQVMMEPGSREKTAFVTHAGLYEFNVMPFGLCNAPATFQRLMNNVLSGLVPQACLDYIDDVLVYGRTFEQHQENLEAVLKRLRDAGLKLKPAKCRLAQERVKYLGYVVSQEGLSVDEDKVKAVRNFPRPTSVKQVRSFVGLTSYYRRFIPQYAKVAGPLHQLTHSDVPFCWSEECERSFNCLKELLTEAPVLITPDFAKPFRLETDASLAGLGAVLAQESMDQTIRPVAYASHTLQGSEKNYSSTELEALGVIWAT